MLKASFFKYQLQFKQASGTSRGVLTYKNTWFLNITDGEREGIGECGMFEGLSIDDKPDYEAKLQWVCDHIDEGLVVLIDQLTEYPSIQFGLEIAFKSLKSKDKTTLFPSSFTEGNDAISINGLIWMGSTSFMKNQIKERLNVGFRCLKLKIGAINFEEELAIIKAIRAEYNSEELELRVDANGAFKYDEALEKLKRLSEFKLHSIEQPIKQGQWNQMASLCANTPLDIALDEELIGVHSATKKNELLQTIQPQYIILKPTLIGGFSGSDSWINCAENIGCRWWITSALESNIGLNAIAQYTYQLNNEMPQGLGTGSLFTNNIDAPLEVKNATLRINKTKNWNLNSL